MEGAIYGLEYECMYASATSRGRTRKTEIMNKTHTTLYMVMPEHNGKNDTTESRPSVCVSCV